MGKTNNVMLNNTLLNVIGY